MVQLTIREVAASMWNMFTTKRFLMFSPQLFWSGISIAYFSGNLMELIQNTIDDKPEAKFE